MATFRVGFPPYTLILAQVMPGYDGAVADTMAAHFKAGHQPEAQVKKYIYFAFSEYDVLAIVPLWEEGYLDKLTTFGHERVRDLQQILCFPWVPAVTPPSEFRPGPALTLTFFKLDETLLDKEGIHAEYDAVQWLQEQISRARRRAENRRIGLDGLVLGTLGWPELLLILTGSNLEKLLRIVRDLATTPIERPGNKSSLVFTFSHTLPCVRWDGSSEKFSPEPVSGHVSCHVMVSARPERLAQVVKQVRNLPPYSDRSSDVDAQDSGTSLWDVRVVFGRRDLLITPLKHRFVSINSLVDLLSMLRAKESDHPIEKTGNGEEDIQPPFITATHTHISIPAPEEMPTPIQTLKSRERLFMRSFRQVWSRIKPRMLFGFRREPSGVEEAGEVQTDSDAWREVLKAIDWYEDWERHLGNPGLAHAGRLRQMLFRYQAVQCTPELQGIADDMEEVLKRSIEDATVLTWSIPAPPIPMVAHEVREAYREFEEIANLFFFGLDQRLAGAIFGVSDPARAYTHLHALGIQRILGAADAIPRALLQMMRTYDGALEWPGFVVFGYCNEAAKLPFNVLNMPYQDVAAPSEWWRLAHEAGHACVELQSLPEFPGFRTMSQRLDDCRFEDIAKAPEHFLDELAANVFEFEFAFRCHFDFYLRTVWRFFNRHFEGQAPREKLRELLLRAVFVFLYDLERQGILRPGEAVEDAIEQGRDHPTVSEHRSMDRSRSLSALGEYESLEDLIEKVIVPQVMESAPKIAHAIRGIPVQEVAERYRVCEPWRSEIANLFRQFRFGDPYVSDLESRLGQYWELLRAGKVLDDISSQDLFLLPLTLQHRCQILEESETDAAAAIPMQARIACILSLWHWNKRNSHPKIDAQLSGD